MEIKTEIEGHEYKIKKDGKTTYSRFKTSHNGWLSCWNAELSKDILNFFNEVKPCFITLDVVEKNGFKNIVGADILDQLGGKPKPVTNVQPQASNSQIKPIVVQAESSTKNAMILASYGKDMLVAGKAKDITEAMNTVYEMFSIAKGFDY